MSASADTLIGSFAITDMLMPLVLADLSEEDARVRARGEEGPSILWTAGHLLHSRCWVLSVLGAERANPWEEHFGMTPATDGAGYPSVPEILAAWEEVRVELVRVLSEVAEDQITARVEKGWHEGQTVRDQVTFFGWHEGYHVGVIGALRKRMGYKAPSEKIMEARQG